MRVLKLKYYAIWTLSTQLMIINGVTLKGSPRPCDVHVLFDLGVVLLVLADHPPSPPLSCTNPSLVAPAQCSCRAYWRFLNKLKFSYFGEKHS